jgi:replication initiation protein RepC
LPTIARKAIAQILETAEEYGFDNEEWKTLADETKALTRALRFVECPDEMETGVTSLERRQVVARERLENLLEVVDSTPKEPENRPHQYNYKPDLDPKQDTVTTTNTRSEARDILASRALQSKTQQQPKKNVVPGVQPDELVRLTPRLKPYLRHPNPTWPDIIDAADWLRHDLGISKSLWGDACLAMGRELAAVALAIVSTKREEHFKTSPGGYFHGMVDKAKAGELHLDRTVWALHRASESECGRGRGVASAHYNGDRA